MRIVKTASVGAAVAMVGAVGLWSSAPSALRFIIELLTYRPGHGPINDYTNQLAWSVACAIALGVGLTTTVAGFVHANRSLGVSVRGRRLLLLGGVAAMTAAVIMLCAVGRFAYLLKEAAMPHTVFTAERLTDSLSNAVGLLHLGLAVLPGVFALLLAASFAGLDEQRQAAASGKWTIANVGLTAFVCLVFAGAFVLNWSYACHLYSLIGSHEAVPARGIASILNTMVDTLAVAGACLALLSVALGGMAWLLNGKARIANTARS